MGHTDYGYWPFTYELSQTAYIKIVLHALKHPSSAVNGILFGRFGSYTTMDVVDAMPVSHSASTFYPPFQIALHQVSILNFLVGIEFLLSSVCVNKSSLAIAFSDQVKFISLFKNTKLSSISFKLALDQLLYLLTNHSIIWGLINFIGSDLAPKSCPWIPTLSYHPLIFLFIFGKMYLRVYSNLYIYYKNKIKIVQIGEYCHDKHQLYMVGYYHANEAYDDCKLGPAACKYAAQRFRHSRVSAVLLVYALMNFLLSITLSSFLYELS